MSNLKDLIITPELKQITIDNEEFVKEFGEPFTFYIKNYMPIMKYFDYVGGLSSSEDKAEELIRTMVLDEKGKPMLGEGQVFVLGLQAMIFLRLSEELGKLRSR